MKIDQSSIARLALPPGKSDAIFFDDKLAGFGIRLRAGGKRTWVIQYRSGAQQRRQSIGDAEKMDAAAARREAKEKLAKVALGGDPQGDKAKERRQSVETLGALIELHLAAKRKGMKPRAYQTIETHLLSHWRPLHRMSIHKIEKQHIAHELRVIEKERGPIAAKRSRGSLSHLFVWAIGEAMAERNPVVGTRTGVEETPRERVLSDAELVAIWNACRDDDYGAIVKLLMLSGQRRDEVASATRSEIDLDARLLKLPGARTKNSEPHDVHLSDPALAIFAAAMGREERQQRPLIFGSGSGSFSGWSAAKRALDARIVEMTGAALADWRLHDLRRTCATRMGKLGVLPHIVEATLNHKSGFRAGVAGVYNRETYDDERQRALNVWGAHIVGIVEGRAPASNIIPMRAAE